jgi:hypothetical protein
MKGRAPRSVLATLAVGLLTATAVLGATQTASGGSARHRKTVQSAHHGSGKCRLDNGIKHVIYVIFDNVHFQRDNPNVPSDVEQMPNLLNFIRGNGRMMSNNHTILISHTAGGILTSLTGMYPDRHGQAVTNSYRYFRADGSTASSSSFKYWTDLTDDVNTTPTNPNFNMVNGDSGTPRNTPAPWVPYTRAGCDWGATALANVVLENTGTGPAGDMTKVFGAGSPEWLEAQASNAAPPGTAARNLAQTDFVGVAIHCAKTSKSICAANPKARPDLLPDEPGGYTGFQGLFGAKYVNPAITGGSPVVNKLNGQAISDQFGQPGFPGFDGLFATTTLAYVATMQEAGIPVTFGYISDAHDQHGVSGEIHATRGPGESDYVAQLKAYDEAFGQFFERLAADGITKKNTLFVFTNEEGDHFSGSQPTPAGCDGVNTPCNYSLIGEINGNLAGLMATEQGMTTPFTVHSDMAPTIYITGNPSRTAAVTRDFGRALGKLTAVNPYTGLTDNITEALADPVGMKALHMITADPQRTPTLTMFALPDYFLFAGAPNCSSPCIFVPPLSNSSFAWNHGGIQPEIATTWLGMVGPPIRQQRNDDTTWADHTDVRPTMLAVLGLEDRYVHDGRVLAGQLQRGAVPRELREHRGTIGDLGATYKQLNAPFGSFAVNTLKASTKAIKGGSPSDDSRYTWIEDQIASLTTARDALATQIRGALDAAAFDDREINQQQARAWIRQAQALLNQSAALAAMT